MPIVFGSEEAQAILETNKRNAMLSKAYGIDHTDYRELQHALKDIREMLKVARQLGDTHELDEQYKKLYWINIELSFFPSETEERAAIERWNEWATGNPAAVNIYMPGYTHQWKGN